MIKISPSILAADFSDLGNEAKKAQLGGADMLHIDVMDGHFVPNITLGPPVIKSLRKKTALFFDVHLMIEQPEKYIESFVKAGADGVTIHMESTENPMAVLKAIHALGAKTGISVKPNTPVDVLTDLLDEVDMVLIMTVEPGFGGQKLIPETIEKVRAMKTLIGNRPIDIQVDGGVTEENISLLTEAGANVIVAGSAVFGAQDVGVAIRHLKNEKKE